MEDKLDCPVYTQEDYQLVSTFIETSQRGSVSDSFGLGWKDLEVTWRDFKKNITFENPFLAGI